MAVQAKTASELRAAQEQQTREWRAGLHRSASEAFQRIGEELAEAINDAAPSALSDDPRLVMAMTPRPDLLAASLNGARFGLTQPRQSDGGTWLTRSQLEAPIDLPFTVISEAVIMLYLPRASLGWGGRSHSLWYCDAVEKNRFAWYETAFMENPFLGRWRSNSIISSSSGSQIIPFHLSTAAAAEALQPGIGVKQVAWPFEELDRADLTEFMNRWLGWFGDAAQGKLSRPTNMPERPAQGSWRKQ
jgi:serine/threonine-protein kinase